MMVNVFGMWCALYDRPHPTGWGGSFFEQNENGTWSITSLIRNDTRSVRSVRNTCKITFRWSTAVFLGTMVGQEIDMRSRKLQVRGQSEYPRSIYQHLYQKATVGLHVRKFSTQLNRQLVHFLLWYLLVYVFFPLAVHNSRTIIKRASK